jgi:hypothetical protein
MWIGLIAAQDLQDRVSAGAVFDTGSLGAKTPIGPVSRFLLGYEQLTSSGSEISI